jgi:electron transfer flavoprotein alpha subunit
MRVAKVLVVAEQREGKLRGVSGEAVSAAASVAPELGGGVDALVIGAAGLSGEAGALGDFGADRILVAEHEALGRYGAERYASVVRSVVEEGDYAAVVFVATAQGKDLAPRVAAGIGASLAADVTALTVRDGALEATRPIYAGKASVRVTWNGGPAFVSVRPNAFPAEERAGEGAVESLAPRVDPGAWRSRHVALESAGTGTLDVSEASIVVSGGRGMKDPEQWSVLEGLRDAMGNGAALGASRAVVDAGWRPHGEQVGQTGKTVAPRLYFAIGISGAIQHLAGMRTSQVIVAVNKDADAPIFKVADYGIVGDLFEVVPRLADEIRALRSGG